MLQCSSQVRTWNAVFAIKSHARIANSLYVPSLIARLWGHVDLLAALQKVHDSFAPNEWAERLRELGIDRGLNVDHITDWDR